MLEAIRLRTEYLEDPLGIDIKHPRLGWNLTGDRKRQAAFEIRAAHSPEELESGKLVWDSGIVKSSRMQGHAYEAGLGSRERVFWQVRVQDEQGSFGGWSEAAWFEAGLLDASDWTARWISGDYDPKPKERYPADEFRKQILVPEFVKARMYITACGLYEARLNGKKIGDGVLTPGLTVYDKRIQYQVYDIGEALCPGENIWDITLGDGWYRGKMGVFGASSVFGERTSVLAQIEVVDIEGNIHRFITDEAFRWCNDGAIRFNDMKDGETVDASCVPSYQGKANVLEQKIQVCCSNNVWVKEQETFSPKVLVTPDGSTVLDFGQNIAGYVEFSIKGTKGHTVCLTMGEMLDETGNFTLSNLVMDFEFAPDYCDDSRFQTITYTCGSNNRETWKPKFCVQGFQYVKLDNWPEEVREENFQAIAVYSDMEELSQFHCSCADLERLVKNTLWSVKGNFLDVPTDCPTRERAAWSGDAQLFFDTGCYFMDFRAFFRKWIRDIFDDQAEDGKIYNIVPKVAPHEGMNLAVEGSSGWVDAGILIPYRYWKHYGDVELLRTYYQSMKRLADFLVSRMGDTSDPELDRKLPPHELRRYIVTTGFHFGEWNEPESSGTDPADPKYEEATAYLIYSLRCFSEIAELAGEEADAAYYREIAERAKEAYQFYFLGDGSISSARMCKYVRPLALELADENTKKKLQEGLVRLVREGGHHVGTGFLSTPFVLQVLSDAGYREDAYQMLLNDRYPSWIYEIRQGATTVWENWDGQASRNHYSNGAACDWIFRTVCGISIQRENHFRIAPEPGGGLTEAGLVYQSLYGEVSCTWKKESGKIQYHIHIPAGCTASAVLEGKDPMELEAGDYTWSADL